MSIRSLSLKIASKNWLFSVYASVYYELAEVIKLAVVNNIYDEVSLIDDETSCLWN
jgi:hypothetical protein